MSKRSEHCPVEHDLLMVPDLLRAARKLRTLSQRELAVRAGLPKTTIGRLESGETTDPALSTMQCVLAAAELSLIVVDNHGEELSYRNGPDTHLDKSGRHFPAHLSQEPLNAGWWGWGRIAWSDSGDPKRYYDVPDWIYFQRRKFQDWPDWPSASGSNPAA
jgi:transcriptional regulator with XRE-family HTH domain